MSCESYVEETGMCMANGNDCNKSACPYDMWEEE